MMKIASNPHEPFVRPTRPTDATADVLTYSAGIGQPHLPAERNSVTTHDSYAVLPLTNLKAWLASLDKKTRWETTKARKEHLTFEPFKLDEWHVQSLKAIYDEVPKRQGKPVPLYGASAHRIRQTHESFSDRSIFIGAYETDMGRELIGFIKVVFNGDGAHLMQILSLECYRDCYVNHTLVAEAVRVACEQSKRWLHYGSWGNTWTGLQDFKRKFGFTEERVPRYWIPLTWRGSAWLALGCNRSLKSRLPRWVVGALSNWRRKLT